MADADRGLKSGNMLFMALVVYIVASLLVLMALAFIAAIIGDPNSQVNTFWGPLSTFNSCCVCPWALILMIALGGINRLKGIMAQRKEAAKGKEAAPGAPLSKAGAQNDGIKKAEEDLDVWSLIVQLQGPDAEARISAVRGLRGHNTPEVEEELTKAMLEDGSQAVRYEAYLALKFQGKDKIGLLLERLKAAGDTGAKLSLLELLRKTGDANQAGTLVYLYDFETDKSVRLGILDSLGKFCHFSIRDLATSVLSKEEDKDIRLKAIEALRWYEDGNTQGVLDQLRRDPDTDIRNSADRVLKSIRLRV